MCHKDDLVSYLYDDLDASSRAAFEHHLRACAECRDELQAMRAVRADLLTWSPPEPDFAFRIVKEPITAHALNAAHPAQGSVLRPNVPSWRAWFTPAAGFAAAAVLVLAAAAGLARVEVHNGPDGWTMRTGSSAPAPGVADAEVFRASGARAHDVNLATSSDTAVWASIERRIAALEVAAHDYPNVRNASARSTDAEIIKVVHDLLDQSERRQKGEYAVRLAQLMRDIDLKRAADLNNMRVGISNIDANVTAEAATHREMMNYLIASSKQK
jgi:anti-sigma factor RsiW